MESCSSECHGAGEGAVGVGEGRGLLPGPIARKVSSAGPSPPWGPKTAQLTTYDKLSPS